jgi:hypothetical protein
MADYAEILARIRGETDEQQRQEDDEGLTQVAPPAVVAEDILEGLQQPVQESVAPSPLPTTPTPQTDYSDVLSRISEEQPAARPTLLPEETAPEPVDFTQRVYSEKNLIEDDFYKPIEDYMVDRFGTHIRDVDRADVVEMFTNNMRGFTGGNSVRALNEISYLNEVTDDEDKLARAGQAYSLYEGMQSVFGETTAGEKAEIVFDFARSAVLDPVNVLTLGVGKVVSGGGFKLGSQVALIAAKKAYNKSLATTGSRELAAKAGERALQVLTRKAQNDAAKAAVKRQAVAATATTTLQRMTTPIALKEAAVMGGLESAISAGTDYLYQDAMLRTAVQDEYNVYQTGLSAVIGLVAGGISGAASNVGTGASGLVAPQPLKVDTKGSTALGKLVNQAPSAAATATGQTPPNIPTAGNWLKDVAKGKELQDQDTQFFYTMLLGDSDKGLKGLAHILLEDGYAWVPRNSDDKVSNWVGDIIKNSDPQDAKKFLDDFTKATGIKMNDGKKLTIDAFADTFKRKMSDSGYVLNAASQVARLLGRDAKDITLDEYAGAVIGGASTPKSSKYTAAAGNFGGKFGTLVAKDIPDFQNNLIRLMVSNLSTTALNVTGFAAATGLNSASDIARAVLLGGQAGLQLVANPAAAKEAGLNAAGILANQVQKARLTLDTNTTYETFMQYARMRPKGVRELTAVLPGGVESLEKISKGFDPDKPISTLVINQGVDVIARLNLVSAQDGITKSIEFLSQMDKFLRRPAKEGGFGMSWNEFFSNPNQHKMMLSERFVNLEARVVDETLKAVFSKSYKGKDFVGEIAGVIEDARNIPGIGLLIPFGRFFNNTVAATYDMTAIGPLVAKTLGGQQDKLTSEIIARGVVSWTLIGLLAEREGKYISMGLGWSEEVDEEVGEVIDERFEFPYGAYKAAARLVAHRQRGEEIPTELIEQLGEQFIGQLTRQLGEAGTGLKEIITALLSDEGPDYVELLGGALGSIVSQGVSAATRPLEPINTLVGLSRDEDFYVPDRNQGEKWVNNSLRYVDQAVALIRGENVSPPAMGAAGGQPRTTPSRLVSTTRALRLTDTQRVMNLIGKPTWLANMASLSDEADNRYNQVFHEIVESQSSQLLQSKGFREGSLEYKQNLVTNLISNASNSTKAFMAYATAKSGDAVLVDMIEISRGNSRKAIDRVMKEMGFEKGFDELNGQELEALRVSLKYRKEFLQQKFD